jgi:hypothetical protein
MLTTVLDLICFDAKIVPDLAIENLFKLASMSFWDLLSFFECFLTF